MKLEEQNRPGDRRVIGDWPRRRCCGRPQHHWSLRAHRLASLNVPGAPALDMRTMSPAKVKAYTRSNYDVVVNYLFRVLRQIAKQGFGPLAQTNSLADFLGVPLQGPYSWARGAVRLLIDVRRMGFAPYGVKFVSVYPCFVAPEHTADDAMPAGSRRSRRWLTSSVCFAASDRSTYSPDFKVQGPGPTVQWVAQLPAPAALKLA